MKNESSSFFLHFCHVLPFLPFAMSFFSFFMLLPFHIANLMFSNSYFILRFLFSLTSVFSPTNKFSPFQKLFFLSLLLFFYPFSLYIVIFLVLIILPIFIDQKSCFFLKLARKPLSYRPYLFSLLLSYFGIYSIFF